MPVRVDFVRVVLRVPLTLVSPTDSGRRVETRVAVTRSVRWLGLPAVMGVISYPEEPL
jgi:hypothetical protein